MKPTKVYYEMCINLGDYEHEKIGIDIELEDGDTVTDAVKAARQRIEVLTGRNKLENDRKAMQKCVSEPDKYSYSTVKKAEEWLAEHPENNDDLPF